MTTFNIDPNSDSNKQNDNAYYNQFTSVQPTGTAPLNHPNIRYHKSLYDQNKNISIYNNYFISDNDTRSITINWTPKSIRDFTYNIGLNSFASGYPITNTYNLCPQKISTVFTKGSSYWSQSQTNNTISYPVSNNFTLVSDPNNLRIDCGTCEYTDFSGDYVLDWSATGPKLISSNNPNISSGSFDFNISGNFFNIFLYTSDSNAYVHIRYRIPIRYRYAYGDWAFWESLIISGEMSETEYVKVVNCCTQPPSLEP